MENKSCCGKCKDKCLWGGCLCETKPLCPCHKQGEEKCVGCELEKSTGQNLPNESHDTCAKSDLSSQPTQSWEERFDETFYCDESGNYKICCQKHNETASFSEVKNFTRSLLKEAREAERAEIVKLVEGMKIRQWRTDPPGGIGYNQAVGDFLTLINQRK